jgi:serine/threonine-protein kinase
LLGSVVGGRWTLERALGSGATAYVYAARDASGMRAAVKLLRPEIALDPELRMRFEREGRVAVELAHPGVVAVLDQDTSHAESAYIAMELLEGEPLSDRASRLRRLTPEELLGYADEILDVLALAHSRGIVHRDLKPGNLFVTREGRIKLLDFGLARLLDPSARGAGTQHGLALGTASYMAPEQARGRPDEIDGRTDLFALGAILFRLSTTRRVHEADGEGQVLAAMATRAAAPLVTVWPEAPPYFAAIVDYALGFEKATRYPDAAAMQADVRAVRRGQLPTRALEALAARERPTVAPERPAERVLSSPPERPSKSAPRGSKAPPSQEASSSGGTEGLVGTIIAGRYRVERLLGAGGMGAVYRAQHVHMRKNVAIKVLHREMTHLTEVVARFEREAIAAGRIEHENVATAKDFGRLEDGSFCLVLEYVEGHSLREALDQGPLPASRAVAIARQITSALGAAHQAGIVHRDLKPENVMLVPRPDGTERVKVLDFGIAKLSASDTRDQPALTQLGSVFGTPDYMAPEQAMGQEVDQRADLYALGILCHEMLVGVAPFSDDDLMAVLTRQMTEKPPPLPAVLGPELNALVMRLLEKDPAKRFPNAAELLDALDALPGLNVRLPQRSVLFRSESDVSAVASSPIAFGETLLELPSSTSSPFAAPRSSSGSGTARAVSGTGTSVVPFTVRAEQALGDLTARVERLPNVGPLLARPVRVVGQDVPLFALIAAAASLAFVGAFLGILLYAAGAPNEYGPRPGASGSVARAAPRATGMAADAGSELPAATLAQASQGQAAALAALQKKPADKRSPAEWEALTLGWVRADVTRNVAEVRTAFGARPELARSLPVLLALRAHALVPSTSETALDLLELARTKEAADVVYDIAQTSRGQRELSAVQRLAKTKLADGALGKVASPALRVALDLESAKLCADVKAAVERAVSQADNRSESRLKALTLKRGCGLFRRQDCFPCLRADDALERAQQRAKSTPGPDFG